MVQQLARIHCTSSSPIENDLQPTVEKYTHIPKPCQEKNVDEDGVSGGIKKIIDTSKDVIVHPLF